MKTLMAIGERIAGVLFWLVTFLVLPIALIVGVKHFPKYLRVTRM